MEIKYPYTGQYVSLGFVIESSQIGPGRFLVLNWKHDGIAVLATLVRLNNEDEYRPESERIEVYNRPHITVLSDLNLSKPNLTNFTVFEQRVRMTHDPAAKFVKIPEGGLGETVGDHGCYCYDDELSVDNPLRQMRYWMAPGGKNLAIIHCLEWAEIDLKRCDQEMTCKDNKEALPLIQKALWHMQERRRKRIEQGILGENKPHTD